jgi:hypothetical protein
MDDWRLTNLPTLMLWSVNVGSAAERTSRERVCERLACCVNVSGTQRAMKRASLGSGWGGTKEAMQPFDVQQ